MLQIRGNRLKPVEESLRQVKPLRFSPINHRSSLESAASQTMLVFIFEKVLAARLRKHAISAPEACAI
jgi:hypothetical protein